MALNVVRYTLSASQTPLSAVETLVPFDTLDAANSTGTVPVTALTAGNLGKFQATAAGYYRVLVGEDYNLDSAAAARRVGIYLLLASVETLVAGDAKGTGSQDGFGNADSGIRHLAIADQIYAKVKMDVSDPTTREYQNNPPTFIQIELVG